MNVQFPRFKSASRRARNRLVALGVVAAFGTASLIGGIAQAAPGTGTTAKDCVTPEQWAAARCIAILALAAEAAKPDYQPKDMKVGAPGGVIASTLKDPVEINQWRANPQSWIDAKERLAGTSGLTTEDIRSTSRWAPKLLRGAGVAGWLSTGADLSYSLRDGFLIPQLTGQNAADVVNRSFCVRHGNFATDGLGRLAGAGCAEWRLDKDFEALIGVPEWVATGTAGGLSFAGTFHRAESHTWCYAGTPTYPISSGFVIQVRSKSGWVFSSGPYGSLQDCSGGGFQHGTVHGGISPALRLVDETGDTDVVIEEMTAEEVQEDAEWITEVECSDGSVRRAVSAAWQQVKLGAVARPASVQLDGCTPSSVRVGSQKAGTGITPNNPWHPKPGVGKPGQATGTTTAVPKTDMPQPVRDWLEEFPECWDGSCTLTLKKTLDSGTKLDCFDNPLECLDWQEEQQRDPTKYECEYAGKKRPISDCFIYSRVFDKALVQQGQGYADPETGKKPDTGTGTRPTNPGAARVAMSLPVSDPATSRECWPSGWGVFNPFEWVFQPVKCALEWAFVPRTAKITQVQTQIQLAAVNSTPVEIIDGVKSWAGVVPSSDGCMGPVMEFTLFGKAFGPYHPLQACTGPLVQAAAVSKTALSIAFVILGVVAITRYVARIFGYSGVGDAGGSA